MCAEKPGGASCAAGKHKQRGQSVALSDFRAQTLTTTHAGPLST